MCIQYPIIMPNVMTANTEMTVNIMPSAPDLSDSLTFMPKPSPTTDTCRRYLEDFLLNFGHGIGRIMANTSPVNNAIAGEKICGSPIKSAGIQIRITIIA